jgi:translation initiation factor eIF-2B subunit delta
MKKNISIELNKILNNKTLGSSEIESLLNGYFFSIRYEKSKIKNSIRLVKNKLGHFTTINSYLNNLNKQVKGEKNSSIEKFLIDYSKKKSYSSKIIFEKIYSYLKKKSSVITLSRSGTVSNLLKQWHKKNNNLKVVVCESRPKNEGRLTAKELAKAGIKVELITDAMMGIYVPKVDAVIIGADSVLKSGNVVNKVGSHALALLCKENKKPFYVVAAKSKFSNKSSFNFAKENPVEIWNKRLKNVSVRNIYFEEVPKKLITKIFTD